MDVNRILSELDTEIERLQQIRAALKGVGNVNLSEKPKGKRGRPKGSTNGVKSASTSATPATKVVRKRKMSAEGRKKIADAMKRRWANHRKAASPKA